MPKEFFHYPETRPLFDLLEEVSHRSSVSRAQAFEDFLHMSVCALSGGAMEEQYLQTVAKHTSGAKGKRGADVIARLFGMLVASMEETRTDMKDLLGDLFEGAISYGENGQYLTPMPLCRAMARLTVGDAAGQESAEPRTVSDPCCGSGRMLLAVAELHRDWEFVGQDIDLRRVYSQCIPCCALEDGAVASSLRLNGVSGILMVLPDSPHGFTARTERAGDSVRSSGLDVHVSSWARQALRSDACGH